MTAVSEPTQPPRPVTGRGGRVRRRARAGRAPGSPRWVGLLYLAPAVIAYVLFVLAPLGNNLWLSFFNWDGITTSTWAGLDNYSTVFHDSQIRGAFYHSLVLIFFYSVLPVILGLLLAATMSHTRVRGLAGFRAILFLPQVISTVVVAITFQWLYADTGPLNQMLRAIGLGSVARGWLGDFDYALPAVGLIGTWISTGLCMVLLMAGVQRIPITLYEAARVDGCGAIREFFAITLPGLRNELAVVLTITIIAALRSFDIIYVASLGGPGDQTLVPSLVIYRDAFRNNAVGLASAIAIVLTVIILAVAFVVTRLVEDRAK
jgi:raffinose/stachyose/melibiose transport system permease protein